MRASAVIVSLILMNMLILIFGTRFALIEDSSREDPASSPSAVKKARDVVLADEITRVARESDDRVKALFADTRSDPPDAADRNPAASTDEIRQARLVGIIAPSEARLSRIAVVELGTPPRTLRVRRGELIPGTSWRVREIDDTTIIIERNAIEARMSFR